MSISPTSEVVAPNRVANVDILNTHFMNNYGKLGAALHIDRFVMVLNGFVYVKDCIFKNNSIDYMEYLQNSFGDTYGAFQVILNTHFMNNYGKLGALHIDRFVMVLNGFVYVKDCIFKNNSIDYMEYLQNSFGDTYGAFQVGAGAVYINQVPVSFASEAYFSFNIGSAIAAVHGDWCELYLMHCSISL